PLRHRQGRHRRRRHRRAAGGEPRRGRRVDGGSGGGAGGAGVRRAARRAARRQLPGGRARQAPLEPDRGGGAKLRGRTPLRRTAPGGKMTLLAAIPVWVYFVILAITFMVFHVLALLANQPLTRTRAMPGRVVSSIVLLVALVFPEPSEPATVLLALLGAVVAGIVSGRTATPPLPPRREPSDQG